VRATPIGELKGISDSAVLALTRNGVVTVEDLLRRDIDQIAYLVDSMETARRLFDAAERVCRPPAVAPPKDPEPGPERDAESQESQDASASDEQPARPKSLLGETLSFIGELGRSTLDGGTTGLSAEQRLHTLGLVSEGGGGDVECIASLLQGAIVEPHAAADPDLARERFGEKVGDLLDECIMVLSVPVTPVGRPQKAYVEMVARSTGGAKLVCTAHAIATMRAARRLVDVEGENVWSRFHGGREFSLWYYRALRDALAECPLADKLTEAIDALESATEGRAAA